MNTAALSGQEPLNGLSDVSKAMFFSYILPTLVYYDVSGIIRYTLCVPESGTGQRNLRTLFVPRWEATSMKAHQKLLFQPPCLLYGLEKCCFIVINDKYFATLYILMINIFLLMLRDILNGY
jgi:hypothetical protein